MNFKERFLDIFKANIHRDGSDKLLESLMKSDFFIAPASTKYHGAYEGGLCEHSCHVYDELLKECIHEDIKIGSESVAIVALCHDLCKVGFYKVDYRNAKNDKGQWEKVPYYTVDDKFPFGHAEKSIFLIQNHMKLTPEEALAIRFHMGAYEGQHIWTTLGLAYKESPLVLATHIADMKATYMERS